LKVRHDLSRSVSGYGGRYATRRDYLSDFGKCDVEWTGVGLEFYLSKKFGATKAQRLKINVVRYADDFVITGISKEILENEIKPWIETFLAVRGLQLSKEKTRIVQIDGGFDFLGWNFRKYKENYLSNRVRKT
jgi:RNA-directed DNA polymerase